MSHIRGFRQESSHAREHTRFSPARTHRDTYEVVDVQHVVGRRELKVEADAPDPALLIVLDKVEQHRLARHRASGARRVRWHRAIGVRRHRGANRRGRGALRHNRWRRHCACFTAQSQRKIRATVAERTGDRARGHD
jgi:hypothetical protein